MQSPEQWNILIECTDPYKLMSKPMDPNGW